MWTLIGSSPRRVLIYSGNMFNELPDVPYVITMEVAIGPDPMDVELPDGLRVAYTRLDHVPKSALDEMITEPPSFPMTPWTSLARPSPTPARVVTSTKTTG